MNHFNRKRPPKTKKEDISGPQNFEHRKHIGLEDVKQTDSFASGMSTEFGSDVSVEFSPVLFHAQLSFFIIIFLVKTWLNDHF